MTARMIGAFLVGAWTVALPGAAPKAEPARVPATVSVHIGTETLSMVLPDGSGTPLERPAWPNAVTVAVAGTGGLPPGTLRLEAWPFQPRQTPDELTEELAGFAMLRCPTGNGGSQQELAVPRERPGDTTGNTSFREITCTAGNKRVTQRGVAKLVTGAGGVFMATRTFDRPPTDAPAGLPARADADTPAGVAAEWTDQRQMLLDAALCTLLGVRPQGAGAPATVPDAAGLLTANGATLQVAVPAGYAEAPPEGPVVAFRPGPNAAGPAPATLLLGVRRTDPFTTRPGWDWDWDELEGKLCGDMFSGGDVDLPGMPGKTASNRLFSLMCTRDRDGQAEGLYVLINSVRRDDALFYAGLAWRFPGKEVHWLPDALQPEAIATLRTLQACRVAEPGCAQIPLPVAPATASQLQAVQFRGERMRVAVPPRYAAYPPPSLDQERVVLQSEAPGPAEDRPTITLHAVARGEAARRAGEVLREKDMDCQRQVPGTGDAATLIVDCSPAAVGGVRVIEGAGAGFVVVVAWTESRAARQLTEAMRAQVSRILQSAEICEAGKDCGW